MTTAAVEDHFPTDAPTRLFVGVRPTLGADYLCQQARDARWRTRYLVIRSEGEPIALTPLYTQLHGKPPPGYEPWGLHESTEGPIPLTTYVGSRSGFQASWVAPEDLWEAGHSGTLASAMEALTVWGDGQGTMIAFPYQTALVASRLTAVLDDIVWRHAANAATFLPAHLYNSKVRSVLRRDSLMRARCGVQGSSYRLGRVQDLPDRVTQVIADHNVRLGTPDHPEFVGARLRQLASIADCSIVIFESQAEGAWGVLYAICNESHLELLEIGLSPSERECRHAVYIDLIHALPVEFARQAGIPVVKCGIAAELPKKSRGARIMPLMSGLRRLR